jgi:hypothetical protein
MAPRADEPLSEAVILSAAKNPAAREPRAAGERMDPSLRSG